MVDIYKLSKLSNLERVVDRVTEEYYQLDVLLRRLVDEFGLVDDNDGREVCGYCEAYTWEGAFTHHADCPWLAAKEYLYSDSHEVIKDEMPEVLDQLIDEGLKEQ